MHRQVAELYSLLAVSRVISSSLRLDRVLETVIKQGMRALDAEAGTVWLIERDGGRIIPMVALGPKAKELKKLKKLWLHPGEGIAGTVFTQKESLLVEDVRQSPLWAARFDSSSGFITRSILCVPLIYRDKAIGALQFINKRNDQLFDREDLVLAQALASQAAVAIENSRMFEDQIVKAHEEERRRIARDIHDGPAQTLAGLIIHLDVCQRLMDLDLKQARSEVDILKGQLRDGLQELRRIIFDLRPLALDNLGLAPSLRAYLDGVAARTGLKPELEVKGEERRLPPSLEVTLYRLVQEAVSNARKHARAVNVTVKVEFLADLVRAVVEDNGVGFDVETALRDGGDHFGLVGMRERVALLEGTMDISSKPGRGTRISFAFPVTEWGGASLDANPARRLGKARIS